MEWNIFEPDNFDAALPSFINAIKKGMSGEVDDEPEESRPSTAARKKLYDYANVKRPSKIELIGEEGNFWRRNFGDDEEVAWYKFQQAFLTEFKANLSESFDDSKVSWLLEMLKDEVFEATSSDKVTQAKFMEVRGDSKDKNHFWKVVSEIATEKYNMNEVFNMESTVRLTAVENLGKCCTMITLCLCCVKYYQAQSANCMTIYSNRTTTS